MCIICSMCRCNMVLHTYEVVSCNVTCIPHRVQMTRASHCIVCTRCNLHVWSGVCCGTACEKICKVHMIHCVECNLPMV